MARDTSTDAGSHVAPVTRHGRAGSKRLAVLCLVFVVFHLVMTALYLGPTPAPVRAVATRYMEPVFKQSWWVFAPDPGSTNTSLMVRATTGDGRTTPWFDVSRCDVDSAIRYHPMPDRRYLTVFQQMRHLEIARGALPEQARSVIPADLDGDDWPRTLTARLEQAGATHEQADAYVKNQRATYGLASAVARARWGDDVTTVQAQTRVDHTRPFARRNTDDPLKTEVFPMGSTPADAGTPGQNTEIARIYGPQGGC